MNEISHRLDLWTFTRFVDKPRLVDGFLRNEKSTNRRMHCKLFTAKLEHSHQRLCPVNLNVSRSKIRFENFATKIRAEQSRGRPRSENVYDIAPPLLEDQSGPESDNLYEIVDGHD